MGSVTGALETLNLSERLVSYIHSLSHIIQENRVEDSRGEREREGGREKGRGGEEREGAKGGISHCCQAINCSMPGWIFQCLPGPGAGAWRHHMIRPSQLTFTSWPYPFPPLSLSFRAAGKQIAESTPQLICNTDPWLISPPHTALPPV